MVSWDLAERTIDSTSSACRESLQTALEQPNSILSSECQAEVARILDGELHPDDGKLRREVNNNVGQDDSKGSKHDTSRSDGTHATTIVLTFVMCALVAVVALAYYVSGGRNIGRRQMRGGRRPHKKKQDRFRDRGKKRR